MQLKYLAAFSIPTHWSRTKKCFTGIWLLACLSTLAGCTVFTGQPLPAGSPEADVIARLGTPTGRYRLANGHVLEYRRGPWGQETYMARIGPDGRLLSYEQVLTMQKFGTIQVDHDNKEDVLRTIGAPSETGYFPRVQREVWSYPYKESGVWNSLMSVYFDNAGIVRKLENGPDPKFDPDRGRFGGLLR
jgi:hypothetical protein